jgi:hypothetical protein
MLYLYWNIDCYLSLACRLPVTPLFCVSAHLRISLFTGRGMWRAWAYSCSLYLVGIECMPCAHIISICVPELYKICCLLHPLSSIPQSSQNGRSVAAARSNKFWEELLISLGPYICQIQPEKYGSITAFVIFTYEYRYVCDLAYFATEVCLLLLTGIAKYVFCAPSLMFCFTFYRNISCIR